MSQGTINFKERRRKMIIKEKKINIKPKETKNLKGKLNNTFKKAATSAVVFSLGTLVCAYNSEVITAEQLL